MQRRILLGVAVLLSASALLAIGILLLGSFGGTARRIVGTTALLAGYGLVALPGAVLLDRGRARRLALGSIGLAAGSAALALAARRREDDPSTVPRLFAASCVTAAFAAAGFTTAVWTDPHSDLWPRLLAALVVLDLLLAALQPVLARALVSGRGTARTRT